MRDSSRLCLARFLTQSWRQGNIFWPLEMICANLPHVGGHEEKELEWISVFCTFFHNTWLVLVSVLVFVLVSVPVSVLEFSLTNHDSLHGLSLGLGPGLCPGLRLCLCPSLWSGLCLGVCPGLCPGICSGLCKGLCPGLCLRSQDRVVTKKQAEACSGLNLFPPASFPQMNRRRGRKPRRIKNSRTR